MAGNVTWTELGKEKLERDEYRYVSFEFWPRTTPFENPEKAGEFLVNVVTGATLTNDPLFKKLNPVLASARSGNSDEHKPEGDDMDLAKLRTKDAKDLTSDEKAFVTEHKAELTQDELSTLGLAEAPKPVDVPKPEPTAEEEEATKLQASIKAGTHVILEASAYKNLEAQAQANAKAIEGYEREKVVTGLAAHVARGAIKSDDVEKWADKIMDDRSLETLVADLPDNKKVNASVRGNGNDGDANAASALNTEVKSVMASANLKYADALAKVRTDKPELYTEYQNEMKEGIK
jgi:hypothetical protein